MTKHPQTTDTKPEAQKQQPEQPPTSAMQRLLEQAQHGEKEILPKLRALLDERPEIWHHYGDLSRVTTELWLNLISGSDLLFREALRRSVEAQHRQLAGPAPSELEKLLIDRIVVTFLQAQQADLAEATAGGTEGVKISQLRLQRQESAQRRHLAAVKTLALVRRLTMGISVEVRHTGVEPAAQAFAGAGGDKVAEQSAAPAAERLVGLGHGRGPGGRIFNREKTPVELGAGT